MSRKITLGTLLVCVMVIIGLNSCKKDVTVIIEPAASSISSTKVISFASDIVPIINKSCAVSGCHASGAKSPDLSEGKAYSALNNGGYFNKTTPEKSKLYLSLTGKSGIAMPVGSASNPSNINNLVLAWIKQGAKNN